MYRAALFGALIGCALFLAAPISAETILVNNTSVESTFTFTGLCTDCTGTGIGTLVLANYTLGDALTAANFVSFDYVSNLILPGSFHIDSGNLTYVSGALAASLPSPSTVYISNGLQFFGFNATGNWCVSSNAAGCGDLGTQGGFDILDTPEPASFALLLLGLAGIPLVKRLRRS